MAESSISPKDDIQSRGEDAALEAGWQADQAIEAGDPARLAFWKRVNKGIEVLLAEESLLGTTVQ